MMVFKPSRIAAIVISNLSENLFTSPYVHTINKKKDSFYSIMVVKVSKSIENQKEKTCGTIKLINMDAMNNFTGQKLIN